MIGVISVWDDVRPAQMVPASCNHASDKMPVEQRHGVIVDSTNPVACGVWSQAIIATPRSEAARAQLPIVPWC
jgi:hypothetical protein